MTLTKVQSGFIDLTTGAVAVGAGSASTPALNFGDSTTGIFKPATNEVAIALSGSEKLRITSDGKVGVNQVTPIAIFHAKSGANDGTLVSTFEGATNNKLNIRFDTFGPVLDVTAGDPLAFEIGGSEKLRIDSSGNVNLTGGTDQRIQLNTSGAGGNDSVNIRGDGNALKYNCALGTTGVHIFETGGTERMRLNSTGQLLVGKTADSLATAGCRLGSDGVTHLTADGTYALNVNRLNSDGKIVTFFQNTTQEGNISVSGSTVSFSGGHLSRWSQLAGGAERTEILRGSVLSNLDEMCEWAYDAQDAVLYTEDDELPEGVSVGDVKTPAQAAGTEDNEQLNRMKVSDTEGDKNVSGVFQSWDDDDDTYVNDFYCAMTGDFVIRIAQGTTVARGDLLMSAGDGTAKPQDDDIIRSKTIAKVTSTNVSCTYDDGSYCVPCVLMAC